MHLFGEKIYTLFQVLKNNIYLLNFLPKITIITATFNCADSLKKTAISIREQDYPHLQWIIVDGLSNDNTIGVIKDNHDLIYTWISEKDNGIYDAWNKATKYIQGEWVLFFGAGDTFFDSKSLFNIFNALTENDLNSNILLYGNVCIVDNLGNARYIDKKSSLHFWEFGRPALPNHQSVLHSKKLFNNSIPFDSNYKIAGDTKFLLTALLKGKAKYVDVILSKMVDDGISNNPSNLFVTRNEIKNICFELNINVPLFYSLKANIRTYFYFFAIKYLPKSIRKFQKKLFDVIRYIR
jgi:glycosyltransferase involved in cell wall biosynthesis